MNEMKKRLEELKSTKEPITLDEQKQILLNIIKSIDIFCQENSINYYLAYGTLLGAIRHKGFIPWDDDIDIWMPREDYNRFLKEFPRFESRYQIINYDNTKGYHMPFAKVIDNQTVIIEYTANKPVEMGLYIDVFPLEYCGNDLELAKLFYKQKIQYVRFIHSIKNTRLDKKRSLLRKLAIIILKCLYSPFSRDNINRKLDILAQTCSDDRNSKFLATLSTMPYKEKEYLRKEWLGKGMRVPFENLYLKIPENSNAILTQIYGNYMKLPPEEKRCGLHNFVAYWR